MSLLILAPGAAVAEPLIYLVAHHTGGVDTLRAVTVVDTVWSTPQPGSNLPPHIVRITTRTVADTLVTSAVVGDTMRIEFWAVEWPEVIGYQIDLGHGNRGPAAFQFGDFYVVSGLPTTVEGFVNAAGVYEIGQVSLGDSKAEGSGRLGTMAAVFDRSGGAGFKVYSVEITTQDSTGATEQRVIVPVNSAHFDNGPTPGIIVISLEIDLPTIAVTADLDGDGRVSFSDFLAFISHFATRVGDENYDPMLDFNDNGEIGFGDFLLLAQDFGKPPRTYRTISRR